MATARTGGRRGGKPCAAETRSPLRGRGTTQPVHVRPAEEVRGQLLDQLRRRDLAGALEVAAADATWLRPADSPALVLAQLLAAELDGERPQAEYEKPRLGRPPGDPLGRLAPLLIGL